MQQTEGMEPTKSHKSQGTEGKIRLIAFWVLVIVLYFIAGGGIWTIALLSVDFALRATGNGQLSPLGLLSDAVGRLIPLSSKPVFLPPKRFAARVGFVFCLIILALYLLHLNTVFVAAILALFAALESLAGFCAGCYVYDFLQAAKRKTGN